MISLLKKHSTSIFVSIIILLIGYLAFKDKNNNNEPTYKLLYKNRLKLLNEEKKAILISIDSIKFEIKKRELIIDSLKNLKPQIQLKYVIKYKQIDSANSFTIVDEFKQLFAKDSVQ